MEDSLVDLITKLEERLMARIDEKFDAMSAATEDVGYVLPPAAVNADGGDSHPSPTFAGKSSPAMSDRLFAPATQPPLQPGAAVGDLRPRQLVLSDRTIPCLRTLDMRAVVTFEMAYRRYVIIDPAATLNPFDLVSPEVSLLLPSYVASGLLRSDYLDTYGTSLDTSAAFAALRALCAQKESSTWEECLSTARKLHLPADASPSDWLSGKHGHAAWSEAYDTAMLHAPLDMTVLEADKTLHVVFRDHYLRCNSVLQDFVRERPLTATRVWADVYSSLYDKICNVHSSRSLLAVSQCGIRPKPPPDDKTATAGKRTGKRGKDGRKPWAVCFGCGKRGHITTECRSGPWAVQDGKVTHKDKKSNAVFPLGVKTPKAALAKVQLVSQRTVTHTPEPRFTAQVHGPDGCWKDFDFFHDTGDGADLVSTRGLQRLREVFGPEFDKFANLREQEEELGGPVAGQSFSSTAALDVTCRWESGALPHPVMGKLTFRLVEDLEEDFMISYATTCRLRLNALFTRDDGAVAAATKQQLPAVKRVTSAPNPFVNGTTPVDESAWNDGVDSSDGASAFPLDEQQPTSLDKLSIFTPLPNSAAALSAERRGVLIGPLPTVVSPFDDPTDDPLVQVCMEYADCFSMTLPRDPCTLAKLRLELKPGAILPHPTRGRRFVPHLQQVVDDNVADMWKLGIIRLAKSPTASQVLVVPKPHQPGKWRFCIDLRPINNATVLPVSPLPLPDELMESVRGSKFFATLDITSCYWQFEVDENSRPLLSFIVGTNVYEPSRVPFGVHSAVGHVNTEISNLFADLASVKAYLDDLLLHAATREELADVLREVLERLRSVNLVLRPDKCKIGVTEVNYLGYTIDGEGKRIQHSRAQAIVDFPRPTTVKQLRRFLGVVNFVRNHCKDFATVASPLYALLKGAGGKTGKRVTLNWGNQEQKSFDDLKNLICSAKALYHFNPQLPTIVRTDASDVGWGAVLYQASSLSSDVYGDDLLPVAYLSGRWTGPQVRWSTIEKECAALVYACQKWDYYLSHNEFILQTDHRNLCWLQNNSNAKVHRWAASLLPYRFTIAHIEGAKNKVADLLSRPFEEPSTSSPEDLYVKAKAFLVRTRSAQCQDGVLPPDDQVEEFITTDSDDNATWQSWQDTCDLIARYHNSTAGHRGITSTINALDADGHDWPSRSKDVRAYILACAACQATRPTIRPRVQLPLSFIQASEPFEEFHIDWLGPFPPDRFGNRHLLVVIDVFTRFVEIIPTVTQGAIDAARGLLYVFGRYGAPRTVRCDNDQSFLSALNKHIFDILGIKVTTSVPYDSKTNGAVERCNQEILRHLRALLFDKPELKEIWAESHGIAQRIINATKSLSSGVAAITLLYCGQVSPDRFIMDPDTANPSALSGAPAAFLASRILATSALLKADDDYMATRIDEYVAARKAANDIAIDNANVAQKAAVAQRQAKQQESSHGFETGDLVLLSYPNRPPSKLSAKMRGPFKISSINKNIIVISSLVSSKVYRVDASRLRKWTRGDMPPSEAFHRAESGEFVVESIVNYGVHPDFHGADEDAAAIDHVFLVHWEGFEVEDRTWEPFFNVKDTSAFRNFIKSLDKQEIAAALRDIA